MAGENDSLAGIQKTVIPPPPAAEAATTEVVIRTMAGDLALLGQTGGSSPQGESVSIRFTKPGERSSGGGKDSGDASASYLIWGGVAFAAVAVFLAGYFLIPRLFPRTEPAAPKTETGTGPAPKLPVSSEPVFLGHASYFRTEADDVLTISMDAGTDAPQTYEQQVSAALAVAGNGALFELAIQGGFGRPVAWTEYLRKRGIALLTNQVWSGRFEQDFTAFVYRDEAGLWPGYVLKLQKGQNALAVKPFIQAMEKEAAAIELLFLFPPGGARGAFRDVQFSGQPIRIQTFENTPAAFAYGWFLGNYLVIGTSEEAVKQAVRRL